LILDNPPLCIAATHETLVVDCSQIRLKRYRVPRALAVLDGACSPYRANVLASNNNAVFTPPTHGFM
jgi:hypothetical protein